MWAERIAGARANGMAAAVDATLARWFTQGYRDSGGPALARVGDMIRTTPVEGFAGCCRAISRIDYLGRVSEIAVPVLLVAGAEDPATPVAAHRAIHERISGSELVVIENAAHLANVERPAEFNRALEAFLARA